MKISVYIIPKLSKTSLLSWVPYIQAEARRNFENAVKISRMNWPGISATGCEGSVLILDMYLSHHATP
jgi:hypothetical protein